MLDIGWTEIVVIAVVAILVVGPKDLPRMLRAFGQTLGQLRRSANAFKRQFDDALREAEHQADFEDTRKQVQSISRMDPLSDVKKGIEKDIGSVKDVGRPKPAATPKPVADDGAGQPEPKTAPAGPEAAAEPRQARRDSDAA